MGVVLIVGAGLTFLVVLHARKADLVVDCAGLRTQELEQSRDHFVASSEVEIARLRLQRDKVREEFNDALDAVADAGQRARAAAALEDQQIGGESTSEAEEAWIAARAELDREIHFRSSRNAKRVEVAFSAQEVDRAGGESAMAPTPNHR